MLQLDDNEYDRIPNDSSLRIQIITLFWQFKMLTSMALELLTNKIYSLEDTYYCQPLE